VVGINREFADTTDQSCLNRFLTEASWDPQLLNERRLEQLQKDSSTRYTERGVIAIDNVLLDHQGELIEDVGWYWDHAQDRYKVAHDYLIVNYVCSSNKHYPLEFRRFRKREQCQASGEEFLDHTQLCCQLVDWVCQHKIPGTFTFDSYFTNAIVLNHAKEWALRKLTTIGEACRAVLRETIRTTLAWAIQQATEHSHDYDYIITRLRLT
jgi:hypothetical protein